MLAALKSVCLYLALAAALGLILAAGAPPAGASRSDALKQRRATCSIEGVNFAGFPPSEGDTAPAVVTARGTCHSAGKVVPGRWSYAYTVYNGIKAPCSDAPVLGPGRTFKVKVGAAYVVTTFHLRPLGAPGGASMTRKLTLLNTRDQCGPLPLPSAELLVGGRVAFQITQSSSPPTNPDRGCEFPYPGEISAGHPGGTQTDGLVGGWALGPYAEPTYPFFVHQIVKVGWRNGTVYGTNELLRLITPDGTPAAMNIYGNIAPGIYPSSATGGINSIDCAKGLTAEPSPLGMAYPFYWIVGTTGVWGGEGCGYFTVTGDGPWTVTFAFTQARATYNVNSFGTCASGQLIGPRSDS